MIDEHHTQIRVRYSETDAMGLLHHSNYLTYFEIGRTELFRAQGGSYRVMEEQGLYFVVAKIQVRFRKPARYDDDLVIHTQLLRSTPARIEHHYRLLRGEEVLAEADTVIACVNGEGELQRIPENLAETTAPNGQK
jgi:acyl-CoA thioester hydrolase